jgi:hypothetical protein
MEGFFMVNDLLDNPFFYGAIWNVVCQLFAGRQNKKAATLRNCLIINEPPAGIEPATY